MTLKKRNQRYNLNICIPLHGCRNCVKIKAWSNEVYGDGRGLQLLLGVSSEEGRQGTLAAPDENHDIIDAVQTLISNGERLLLDHAAPRWVRLYYRFIHLTFPI